MKLYPRLRGDDDLFQFYFEGETRRQRANDGAWLLPIYRLYNHGLPLAGEDSTHVRLGESEAVNSAPASAGSGLRTFSEANAVSPMKWWIGIIQPVCLNGLTCGRTNGLLIRAGI